MADAQFGKEVVPDGKLCRYPGGRERGVVWSIGGRLEQRFGAISGSQHSSQGRHANLVKDASLITILSMNSLETLISMSATSMQHIT